MHVTPGRPSAAEVAALWENCIAVTADAEVAGWLQSCRIRPERVASRDLARALPVAIATPAWARYAGIPWNTGGYRLLVPLYGPVGRMEALYARSLQPIQFASMNVRRSTPVMGGPPGLAMANATALALLRSGVTAADSTWPTITVAGGAADFLDWATSYGDPSPAVLGMIPGTWTHDMAARVPAGYRIIVRAHQNPIAQRYAQRISELLGRRCNVVVRTV